MMRFRFLILLLVPTLFGTTAAPAQSIRWPIEKMAWHDAPPNLPPGTRVMVLEGDPKVEGLFTMRLKIPDGTVIAPHSHPRAERVTVLSGAVLVGLGDTVTAEGTLFEAGSFYVNAPGLHHFVVAKGETVLQLTCMGPWKLDLVKN